ncbi:MAG: HPr family phosphocarrier protein [Ruminococcaceae bacterium]|nr:HPr family phosphocarrier protein [Oscillospiraceae bacterium]
MKQFTYRIEDQNGLHARPAGQLANFAKQFQSNIRVKAAQKEADAKRLLSLMSLGAVFGTELLFCVEGEDENAAAVALENFCKNRFQPSVEES